MLLALYASLFWIAGHASETIGAWDAWVIVVSLNAAVLGIMTYLLLIVKRLQRKYGLLCPGCGALLMWERWSPERSNGKCTKCECQIVAGPIGPPPLPLAPKWINRTLTPGWPSPRRWRVLVFGGLGLITATDLALCLTGQVLVFRYLTALPVFWLLGLLLLRTALRASRERG